MEVAVLDAAFALYQKVYHQLGWDGVDGVDPVDFLDVCFWSSHAVQKPGFLEGRPYLAVAFLSLVGRRLTVDFYTKGLRW